MTEPVDLDALEALTNAATPGHWVVRRWRVSYDGSPQEPYDEGDRWEITAADGAGVVDVELDRDYNDPEGGCLNERDAYFIAAARSAVPALIAELRSARAAIPGPDTITVNREALVKYMERGPDADTWEAWCKLGVSLEDAAALSEPPAPKEQQP